MDEKLRQEMEAHFKARSALPAEVARGLKEVGVLRREHNLAELRKDISRMSVPRTSAFGNKLLRRHPRFKGTLPPPPPPFVCTDGCYSLEIRGSAFDWGTAEDPQFGTAVQYPNLPNVLFHKSSVRTRRANGEISLAVAASTGATPSYSPEIDLGNGVVGNQVSGGFTESFYFPDFKQRKITQLQTKVLVTSYHNVRESVMWPAYYQAYQAYNVAYGYITITLSQGLDFLWPQTRQLFLDSERSSQTQFLAREFCGEHGVVDTSTFDDNTDNETLVFEVAAPYDGVSTIFWVDVDFYLFAGYRTDSVRPKQASGAVIDLRSVGTPGDDALQVVPDNAPFSCSLAVEAFLMCGK